MLLDFAILVILILVNSKPTRDNWSYWVCLRSLSSWEVRKWGWSLSYLYRLKRKSRLKENLPTLHWLSWVRVPRFVPRSAVSARLGDGGRCTKRRTFQLKDISAFSFNWSRKTCLSIVPAILFPRRGIQTRRRDTIPVKVGRRRKPGWCSCLLRPRGHRRGPRSPWRCGSAPRGCGASAPRHRAGPSAPTAAPGRRARTGSLRRTGTRPRLGSENRHRF